MLFLRSIDQYQQPRRFSCQLSDLEALFAFLNGIVAQGSVLQQAYTLDNNVHFDLPLAVFDGHSLEADLADLQHEWEDLLDGVGPLLDAIRTKRLDLARWQVNQYASQLTSEQQMINLLIDLLQQTREGAIGEPKQSRLVRHYEALLERCYLRAQQKFSYHERAKKRLGQLILG